jgi:regulator of protease activity HflC (stomatin/prohibitin superfamily)
MPKDELNLTLEIRGIFTISSNERNVNKIFNRITPEKIAKRISYISMNEVYKTYAQPIIRETTRSIISNYTIKEIMSNREEIGKQIEDSLVERLKDTPIVPVYVGMADIQPPDVIVLAQESAKKREIAIKEAENEKMVSLEKAKAAYEVAIKQQQVDLKEAETQVLVNKKLTEGVNEAFVTQRALKVLTALAENPNTVFFMPMEAMKNPNMILGALNKENMKNR